MKNIYFKLLFCLGYLLVHVSTTGQNNLIPNTSDCSSAGSAFAFDIQRAWITSTGNSVFTDCTPLAGDIDGDGKTEIFAVGGNFVYVFEGEDGSTIGQINPNNSGITSAGWTGTPFLLFRDKNSGKGRILITHQNFNMYLYEVSSAPGVRPITFTQLWAKAGGYSRPYVSPIISDLNGDGTPEFVIGNKIVDYNGNVMATMAFSGEIPTGGRVSLPLAVDLDKDGIPEIVVGTNVYKYNGSTATLWKSCPGISAQEGCNMAADINQDGHVDLVFRTAYYATSNFVKVWTPATNQDLGFVASSLPVGQHSIPFVGDIDGIVTNGKKYPEICFNTDIKTNGSRGTLYAYSYTGSGFVQKWNMPHSDGSGGTILTLFDFNNDGTMELIYRDETLIHIFDGSGNTPVSKYTQTCGSETATEQPIVVDATSDGSANIVVTGNNTGKSTMGEVMVFEGASSKWASCPNVWNQQLYSSLYVNNDLTIPDSVLSVNQTFTRPDNSTVQFYNGGPLQAPFVSEETYLPVNLSPDIYIVDGFIAINSPTSATLTVTFGNQGLAVASASMPIRYYKHSVSFGNIIGSETLGTDLYPGQTKTITKTITGLEPNIAQFYVRIMDDGINYPALGAYSDCNLTNNTKSFGTLELLKTANSTNACTDGTSIFYLNLINNTNQVGTPTTFSNVGLTDSLGTGWDFISSVVIDGSVGAYNPATRKIQWTVPSIAPGDTAKLIITAKATAAGAIRNSSWVESVNGTILGKEVIEAYVIVSSSQAGAPATITPANPSLCAGGVVLTATDSGATSYQWYKNSIEISEATSSTYTATTIGSYTVTYFDGTCVSQMSDSAVATLNCAPLDPGAINTNQTICTGDTPATLTSTTAASGGTGQITYRWQFSIDGGTTWNNITGTAGEGGTYSPGALTTTTYYRRNATDSNTTESSNVIIITVKPRSTPNMIKITVN